MLRRIVLEGTPQAVFTVPLYNYVSRGHCPIIERFQVVTRGRSAGMRADGSLSELLPALQEWTGTAVLIRADSNLQDGDWIESRQVIHIKY